MIKQFLFGWNYFKTKKLIAKTEFMQNSQIKAMQNALIRKVLSTAVKNVPFYREKLKNKFISSLGPIDEILSLFPIIDKQTIRTYIRPFLTGPSFRMLKVTTGGSTGSPFAFYMDRFRTRQVEKAFIFDQWGRAGYVFGDAIFNLRGRIPPKNRFIYHDWFFNIYYASSFNLNADTIADYVSAINKLRPRFLHGYPSTMYQLASLISASKKKINFIPTAVFCGSEKLFLFQKQKIESVFGAPTYHWYGHSECLALGGGCEYSDTFHFYPQYGYTELIPTGIKNDNGQEFYEIVATGFNNPVMPFIRYRTGDYAIPAKSQSCQCGRNYLLIDEVVGREQEFVVDAKGDLISATSLIFGQHYAAFEGIESIKLHQNRVGELDIILVKGTGFQENLFLIMQEKILDLIGDRMVIKFHFSGSTDKSLIGKTKLVEQELDIRDYLVL